MGPRVDCFSYIFSQILNNIDQNSVSESRPVVTGSYQHYPSKKQYWAAIIISKGHINQVSKAPKLQSVNDLVTRGDTGWAYIGLITMDRIKVVASDLTLLPAQQCDDGRRGRIHQRRSEELLAETNPWKLWKLCAFWMILQKSIVKR